MTCRAEGHYIKGRCFLERVAYFLKLYYLVAGEQKDIFPTHIFNHLSHLLQGTLKTFLRILTTGRAFVIWLTETFPIVWLSYCCRYRWHLNSCTSPCGKGRRECLWLCWRKADPACLCLCTDKKSDGFSITSHTCALMLNETYNGLTQYSR